MKVDIYRLKGYVTLWGDTRQGNWTPTKERKLWRYLEARDFSRLFSPGSPDRIKV